MRALSPALRCEVAFGHRVARAPVPFVSLAGALRESRSSIPNLADRPQSVALQRTHWCRPRHVEAGFGVGSPTRLPLVLKRPPCSDVRS